MEPESLDDLNIVELTAWTGEDIHFGNADLRGLMDLGLVAIIY